MKINSLLISAALIALSGSQAFADENIIAGSLPELSPILAPATQNGNNNKADLRRGGQNG